MFFPCISDTTGSPTFAYLQAPSSGNSNGTWASSILFDLHRYPRPHIKAMRKIYIPVSFFYTVELTRELNVVDFNSLWRNPYPLYSKLWEQTPFRGPSLSRLLPRCFFVHYLKSVYRYRTVLQSLSATVVYICCYNRLWTYAIKSLQHCHLLSFIRHGLIADSIHLCRLPVSHISSLNMAVDYGSIDMIQVLRIQCDESSWGIYMNKI